MLKSLFGELAPPRGPREHGPAEPEFADTAVMDAFDDGASIDAEDTRPPAGDDHRRDLFVTGAPVQAMRAHFATQQDAGQEGRRTITLHDPAGMWAPAVVKALSDASGQPVERLQLRDQATLETLAVIERTTLARRLDETLKVYHADLRASGDDVSLVPMALLERADLGAVIIGPMTPSAVDDLLATLCGATASDHWRCPELLFMLPVGALWISHKIDALSWPAKLRVVSMAEPLTSASTVWNRLLAHWNRVKPQPAAGHALFAPSTPMPLLGDMGAPPLQRPAEMPSATLLVSAPAPAPSSAFASLAAPAVARPGGDSGRPGPDLQRALGILRELMLLDGLVFASLVDGNTGQVVASEVHGPDIDRAATAAAEILRLHRRTLRQMGHPRPQDPVDEVMVTAGGRYHILRTLQAHPDHFILAVLDKLRSNLAMTRFRIMEAQQVLT